MFMKIKFVRAGAGVFLAALCAACATTAAPHQFSGATALAWSQRLADSEMARRGDSLAWTPGGKAKWDYTAGLFTLSLLKLNEVSVPDARFVEFRRRNAIGSFIEPDGNIQDLQAGGISARCAESRQDAAGLVADGDQSGPAAAFLRVRQAVGPAPRPAAHARRRLLAQAEIYKPDVAGRDLHGRTFLRGNGPV